MALPAAIALSGLNQEYFSDGLNDVFEHGAVLLKSPSASSIASSSSQESGVSSSSQESGISSMLSDSSTVKNLTPYFELLFQTQIELKATDDENDNKEPALAKKQTEEIIYENRNILDLAVNIHGDWNFQPAVVRSGPSYFFENRSQVSRVLGAYIPEHIVVTCLAEDCLYRESRYE